MVHRGDLRSGGDHLLPLLHDQGGGHVGLLGDGVGGQPPLLADLQECLVGVGVGDGVRALAARDLALEPLDGRRLLGRRGLGLGLGRRAAAVDRAGEPLLVALLLDRVSVYVQHDAD